jgi:hypothetical protein
MKRFVRRFMDTMELELAQRNVADIVKAPRIAHGEKQSLNEHQVRVCAPGPIRRPLYPRCLLWNAGRRVPGVAV